MVRLAAFPVIVPESPRYLVYNEREDKTRPILQRIYKGASAEQVDSVLLSIRLACNQAREINNSGKGFQKIKQLHLVPSNLRALISACGLMVISQFSGFNCLMYYSGSLISAIGFSNPTAGTNFIMTWVNMMVIDKMGRRRLLLPTVWGMSVGMIVLAILFKFILMNMETGQVNSTAGITTPAILVIVFMVWFAIFYGVSVGNTAWMSTDFFPLEVRAMGTMWLTCSNWGSNVIVSSTFLSMIKTMTPSAAWGFHAAICGLGYIWIYFFYPEVSGLTA